MFKEIQTSEHLVNGKKYKIVETYSGKYLMVQRKNQKWYSVNSNTSKGKKIFNDIYINKNGSKQLKRKW